MRRFVIWTLVVAGLGAVSYFVLLPIALLVSMGIAMHEKSPQEIEAEAHEERGCELEHAGRLDEAIAEFRLAHKDGLFPMMTRYVAELLEKEGRYEEALAEIDRGGPKVSWGEYCDLRTRCLEAWKGPDAAVAWLLEKDREDPTNPRFQREIGEFHYYGGRPKEAIAPLLEAERRALVRQKLHWNESNELDDDDATPHEVNDLCDLWPTLEVLCRAYEAAGDDPNAWASATREVSLHQRINRLKAYYGERWQTAGSFDGRMVRARILMRRGDLDAADVELGYAEEVKSNYTPHQRELDAARAEIRQRRAR